METLVARVSYTMVKSGSAYALFTGQCDLQNNICQSILVFLTSLFFFASEGIYRLRCLVVNSYIFLTSTRWLIGTAWTTSSRSGLFILRFVTIEVRDHALSFNVSKNWNDLGQKRLRSVSVECERTVQDYPSFCKSRRKPPQFSSILFAELDNHNCGDYHSERLAASALPGFGASSGMRLEERTSWLNTLDRPASAAPALYKVLRHLSKSTTSRTLVGHLKCHYRCLIGERLRAQQLHRSSASVLASNHSHLQLGFGGASHLCTLGIYSQKHFLWSFWPFRVMPFSLIAKIPTTVFFCVPIHTFIMLLCLLLEFSFFVIPACTSSFKVHLHPLCI